MDKKIWFEVKSMFTQEQPVTVDLKSVYYIYRYPWEHAVASNIHAGTPHSFTFSLAGKQGVMTVDDMPESRSVFHFPTRPTGYFSLASNATETEPGAFRYVRLKAGEEILLDIDFQKIQTVDALEAYFDCYYFPDLEYDRIGRPVSIRQFWGFNARGNLHCIRERTGKVSFSDSGPFCVLTLRQVPLTDFEVQVGFEQCWRRYGIVFGCDKQKFPYHLLIQSDKYVGIRGGLVYADAHDGSCCVRGALCDSENRQALRSLVRQSHPLVADRFQSKEQTTLPLHTLTYHFHGNMTYRFGDRTFKATPGSVLYLPPGIPCRLEGEKDTVTRIEFECAESFSPAILTPKQPEMVCKLFEELCTLWGSNLPGGQYRALSVFYRIMAEVSQPVSDSATATVRKAIQHINNHFTEPALSIREIAKATDICESYLYRLFRASCGMTPKEYILNCRLQHACALLKTRYYKVYEVAEKCGFSDAKYFMTAFKREMGISPGQYIAQQKEV